MQIGERTKEEVQTRAEKMPDFTRMEYLENCLNKLSSIEIQRYCLAELSRLYERNVMFPEAIKYIIKFQGLAVTNREKLAAYIREIELLIKGGYYERVEYTYEKASQIANDREKEEVKKNIFNFYKSEAEKYERANKNSVALKAYERLLPMSLGMEKIEIKKKLFNLYKKLGKVRESLEIEKELQRDLAYEDKDDVFMR